MQDSLSDTAPLLLVEEAEAGVSLLTLNRPHARNALSRELIAVIHREIERLGSDPKVAAIVLAANGKVFSSGHDLKELTSHRSDADGGLAFFRDTMQACSAMMLAIVACPKPVIAAVEAESPCRDVVTQLSAVSSALDRAGFAIVSTAMKDCIADPDAARDQQGLTTEELEKLFLMLA